MNLAVAFHMCYGPNTQLYTSDCCQGPASGQQDQHYTRGFGESNQEDKNINVIEKEEVMEFQATGNYEAVKDCLNTQVIAKKRAVAMNELHQIYDTVSIET